MLKPSGLPPCALALAVGEIRTSAGSSVGLGYAQGRQHLQHVSEGAVVKEPVGFLPAPGDTADVERIRKMSPCATHCAG